MKHTEHFTDASRQNTAEAENTLQDLICTDSTQSVLEILTTGC